MKILYVITGLGLGGAETQLLYLASQLLSRGYSCKVISMTKPTEIVEKYVNSGISVETLDMKPGIPSVSSVLKLKRIIINYKPDIVHSHMIHANLLCRATKVLIKFPLINTAHSVYEGSKLLEYIFSRSDYLCELTTQVSHEGLNRYIERKLVKKGKSKYVENAVRIIKDNFGKKYNREKLVNELNLDDLKFIFLSVGRLEPVKDHKNLLDAIVRLERSDFIFLIVGRGYLESYLKEEAIRLGIAERIIFLGARTDIEHLVLAADGFVMSSKYEGLPISILEAMSGGLPIVTTRVGAIPDVIEHGVNGYLCEPNDSQKLSVCLESMLELNNDQRIVMGELSKKQIKESYSSEVVSDSWEIIYKQISV